jgi:hypothetical protein
MEMNFPNKVGKSLCDGDCRWQAISDKELRYLVAMQKEMNDFRRIYA